MLKIVIGNKNYSSWSFRGWLALKLTGAPFEELLIGRVETVTTQIEVEHVVA